MPFEQIVRDLEEQSPNVRFVTCNNDEQTLLTRSAIKNMSAVNGSETNWTLNGTATPVTPPKETRPLIVTNGVMATAEVVSNAYAAAKGAHALVVCTEWDVVLVASVEQNRNLNF